MATNNMATMIMILLAASVQAATLAGYDLGAELDRPFSVTKLDLDVAAMETAIGCINDCPSASVKAETHYSARPS